MDRWRVRSGAGGEAGTRYKDLGLVLVVELGLTGRLPMDGPVVGGGRRMGRHTLVTCMLACFQKFLFIYLLNNTTAITKLVCRS